MAATTHRYLPLRALRRGFPPRACSVGVPKHKQDEQALKEKVQDDLVRCPYSFLDETMLTAYKIAGNKVIIGNTEEIGSVPLFFSSNENLLGIIVYNVSEGGMVATDNA